MYSDMEQIYNTTILGYLLSANYILSWYAKLRKRVIFSFFTPYSARGYFYYYNK